jgi:hypothetical protein
MYFINSQDPHLQSLPICPELYHTQNPGTFFFPLMNKAQNYSQIGIVYKAVCNQMHHWLLLLIKLMGLAFRVQALGFRINTNLCSTLKSNVLESVLLSREVFFLVHLHCEAVCQLPVTQSSPSQVHLWLPQPFTQGTPPLCSNGL